MRILVATHNYPRFAGDRAGAFVARLAAAAAGGGHVVRVVAPHAPGAPERERMDGVDVVRVRYAPERWERVGYRGDLHRQRATTLLGALGVPAFLLGFRRTLRRELRNFSPDVVHAHWWFPAGWLATSLATVPVVVTIHGSDARLIDRGGAMRRLAGRVLGRASAVTTVSKFLADDVLGQLPDLPTPVLVAPMAVDVDHFATGRGVPKAVPPRVLYAGNLVPSKGVDVLLRAFARLREAGVVCRLKILGEGSQMAELRALAATLGVADSVDWAPFVQQDAMPAEYGASTVTVLPSRGRAEGLGLTLVEALLAGSAVVGTPAGGIPEVVRPSETGLLASDGDAGDLAAQIRTLLEDEALRERLTAAGDAMARSTFAPRAAAQRFLDLYTSVATSHPPRR